MPTMTAPATRDELLATAAALVPVLAGRAQECETLRRLPDATIEDFQRGGLLKILQPERWGGYELSLAVLIDVVAELGRGCGSSAWTATVLAIHNWFVGLFPAEAQEEVFGDNPDAILAAVFYPGGTATPVDGGFRLTGRWGFASGCDHGDWIALGGTMATPDGEDGMAPDMRNFLIPQGDYTIVDDWYVSGLRGTGSKSITVEDVFVPAHRVLSIAEAITGNAPGTALHTNPLYRLPFSATLAMVLAAPALGIARGALDAFRARARERVRAYATSDATVSQNPLVQTRLAEATVELETARLLMHQDIATITHLTEQGEEIPLALRGHARLSAAYAAQLCNRATHRVFEAAGGGAILDTSPLQRAVRDLDAMSAHVALSLEGAAESYGAIELGLMPTSLLI